MSLIGRLAPENPVLTKEMRVRMRGARAYWILLGYLGFLTVVLLFTYSGWLNEVAMTGSGGSGSSEVGKSIYTVLLVCQAFLVLFITPAITSGSITIEREQQTLDMLTMTRLSRAGVIAGKLISAVSFTALLLLSSLPLVSICFMLGGVDPAMVFSTYLAMLMGSFLIGALGMMWSSVAKTTTVAVLLTYLCMLGFASVMAFVVGMHVATQSSAVGIGIGGGVAGAAVMSVVETWCSAGFLGIQNVEYVGFALFSLLAGLLLSAVAMARLETWPERRAGLLRGLTALLVLLQVSFGCVWWLQRIYGPQVLGMANSPAIGALCLPLLILMLLTPTFATGEITPMEARTFGRYLRWGWTPKGLVRGKLASGTPFLLLLTLLCIGAYALTFVCFGKAGDLMHSATLPVAAAAPAPAPAVGPAAPPGFTGVIKTNGTSKVYRNGVLVGINGRTVYNPVIPSAVPSPTPAAAAANATFWRSTGDFPQAAILILSFVVGFALLCQLLSVAFDNRWVAWSVAYLCLFVVLVLPWFSAAMSDSGNPWVTVNLAYLNPFFAFAEMTSSTASWNFNAWAVQHLALPAVPMWLTTSLLWAVIGLLSFVTTLPFAARRAAMRKPLPYEEMAAA